MHILQHECPTNMAAFNAPNSAAMTPHSPNSSAAIFQNTLPTYF